MNIAEYHKMHALESTYWWFQGRRQIILTLLEQVLREKAWDPAKIRFLDAGCGTGFLLEDLQAMGTAIGLDFSPVALQYCRDRHLKDLGRADLTHMPVGSCTVDIVLALDMIEHIRNDKEIISEFHRILKPGGIALMSVPAHQSLWSNHDRALHHFRRYGKREFLELVTSAGFVPRKYTYGMSIIFIPAAIFRAVKKLLFRGPNRRITTDEFQVPRPLNAALRQTLSLEARWLRKRNLPLGLSLICIAEKPFS